MIVLPTLNEEAGIADVINQCKRLFPKEKILVIDGRSGDRTVEIARKLGCRVVMQKGRGKGNAVIEAVQMLGDRETVMMVDADKSYDVSDFLTLLKAFTGQELVIGNRFAFAEHGSFTHMNRFGNKCLNLAASILFGKRLRDMLSGIRVFNAGTAKSWNLQAQNFEIETEMTLKALKSRTKVVEVPCHYYPRQGETKLNPLKDGFRIFKRVLKERL